jgi:hypothetical protein
MPLGQRLETDLTFNQTTKGDKSMNKTYEVIMANKPEYQSCHIRVFLVSVDCQRVAFRWHRTLEGGVWSEWYGQFEASGWHGGHLKDAQAIIKIAFASSGDRYTLGTPLQLVCALGVLGYQHYVYADCMWQEQPFDVRLLNL